MSALFHVAKPSGSAANNGNAARISKVFMGEILSGRMRSGNSLGLSKKLCLLPAGRSAPRHLPLSVNHWRKILQLVVNLTDEPVLALLRIAQGRRVIWGGQVGGQNIVQRLALIAELLHLGQNVDEHGAVAQ